MFCWLQESRIWPPAFHPSCFTPVPVRTALCSCGKLSVKHTARNKVSFSLKPRKVINPRAALPCCSLLPHTLLPSPAHVQGNLGEKKRRLSHEVIPLSHFYSSAFSRCLQLSLLYSCTWLLRLWSSPLLHILWCILAYIVCNLTPCHLIPPTSHNPYQPLSPPFHLSFV